MIWQTRGPGIALYIAQAFGVALTIAAARIVGIWELAGVKQPDLDEADRVQGRGPIRDRAASDLPGLGADGVRDAGDDDVAAALRGGQHAPI